jgi:hypothetical protein
MTCCEVCGEQIRDLLTEIMEASPQTGPETNEEPSHSRLRVRETSSSGPFIQGLASVELRNAGVALRFAKRCQSVRTRVFTRSDTEQNGSAHDDTATSVRGSVVGHAAFNLEVRIAMRRSCILCTV